MKKWIHMIAFVLVVVGGVNWGIFGLFANPDGTHIDIIEVLFGGFGFVGATIAEVIYVLIGASAIYLAITHTTDCKVCSVK